MVIRVMVQQRSLAAYGVCLFPYACSSRTVLFLSFLPSLLVAHTERRA